ncbi:MAG: glycine betaine/L-proline ABC transporter ATP-binding protein [Lautropia sp.]
MPRIVVEKVSKIFGPHPARMLALLEAGMSKQEMLERHGHVVGIRDLSLSIEDGETFVVMGLSGSGKSTLIRHLNRLIEPTAGRILVDGQDILRLDDAGIRALRRHEVSMVFQRFGLLPHRTVLENVAYGLLTAGVPRREALERARTQIDLVSLGGFEGRYPAQLSGGMQQRVGLARALATDAGILLMDEAFSALDPVIRDELQAQLRQLQKTLRRTIVFITHDLDEALRVGDRIAILQDGELRQCDRAHAILLAPAHEHVARFVRGVNRAKALTMGAIAQAATTLARSEADAAACLARMGAAGAVLLLDRAGRTSVITESFARAHADRPQAWWRETGRLPDAIRIDATLTIEQGLQALGRSDAPLLAIDASGDEVGVVGTLAAIRALAGA